MNGSQEENEEERAAKKGPKRHLGENEWQYGESQPESPLPCHRGQSEEGHCSRHRDQSAQRDLAKPVGTARGVATEHDVVLFRQVTGIDDDDAKTDGQAEKDLPRRCEPQRRIPEL